MCLTIFLATFFTLDRRDVVEQHCVAPRPFRTPFNKLNETSPSTVDTGGLGLSSKPLDNPVDQRFVVCEAGHRHGHGEVAFEETSTIPVT